MHWSKVHVCIHVRMYMLGIQYIAAGGKHDIVEPIIRELQYICSPNNLWWSMICCVGLAKLLSMQGSIYGMDLVGGKKNLYITAIIIRFNLWGDSH